MSEPVTFEVLVDPAHWRSFDEHLVNMDRDMEEDIALLAEHDRILQKQVRQQLIQEFEVRTVSPERQASARETLFGGKVCAIDGTRSIVPLLGGARCRLGVVAVTYRGKQTESIVFVSEQQIQPPEANPVEILRRRRAERAVVSSVVAGAMLAYMERRVALERPERWRILNGPLVPYELRQGLGRLRALDACLRLAEAVIAEKTIAGASGTAVQPDLASVGFALEPGEYARIGSLAGDLTEYLYGSPDDGPGTKSAAKFSDQDRRRFQEFIDGYGNQVEIGLLRAGSRPYVFHAHRDHFDEVAALLLVDAGFQPLRSYPLLIDYADAVCKRLLASGDFRRQMEVKLAKGGLFELEMPERFFRRR